MEKGKTVVVAPHPDDEWIGCGCTILKKLDEHKKIVVLVITRVPRTERRIRVSKVLAKKHKYDLFILGEPERGINPVKLASFLKKYIKKSDEIYIPDVDVHPDHRIISKTCQNILENKIIQYCVYNNSLNPFIRLKNKLLKLIYRKGFPSFRNGSEDRKFNYKLNIKNSNINLFWESSRDSDVLRKIR